MEAEKIRNLTDVELAHQERELNDQLFKLKFQMKMGQTESLKKIQGLKKDIARIKTIVVELKRQKAHPMYRRVVKSSKKFYAHDEQNTARVGDVVRIEETRPMSRLKRWRLKEVIQRAAIVPGEEKAEKSA